MRVYNTFMIKILFTWIWNPPIYCWTTKCHQKFVILACQDVSKKTKDNISPTLVKEHCKLANSSRLNILVSFNKTALSFYNSLLPFLYFYRGYIAPEFLIGGVITQSADLYSLGVVIIEILTGHKLTPPAEEVRTIYVIASYKTKNSHFFPKKGRLANNYSAYTLHIFTAIISVLDCLQYCFYKHT